MGGSLNRERIALLAVWGLAALACLLGLAKPPADGLHGGKGEQLLDLIRVLSTTALALTLLLGPGIVWRAARGDRNPPLAFLFLPGLAVMAATGGLAWLLAPSVDPEVTSFAVSAPLLGLLLGGLLAAGRERVFEPAEWGALLIVGCVLALAVGRALWSMGPEGELFSGSIARTLEVGDRSDARLSYATVQLVAHGSPPFGAAGTEYFAPYDFSSRGPVPGLASSPVVFLSGGEPPLALPTGNAWEPFDAQGYQAYRLAMIVFACTAFLALWQLVRRLGGETAGRLALLLAATTPFLVHEVWFTWPKMLAAAFVLLAGLCIVERRPLSAGLLVGAGYLMHPGALIWLCGLGLIALWPLRGANWRRPQIKTAVLLGAGVAVAPLIWRIVNGSHYTQSGFTEYFEWASVWNTHPSIGEWISFRAESVANTFVPLFLPIFHGDSVSINVFGGTSPGVIHFFFQYWNGLPFGIAIVFFPLLLLSLWRAARLWPWPFTATVLVPIVFFSVYWGAFASGMMREGLQTWALVLLAFVALQQWRAGFPWLRSTPIRAILTLRTVEVLAIVLVPTLATNRFTLLGPVFQLTNAVALGLILAASGGLAYLVWSARDAAPGKDRARLGLASHGEPDEAGQAKA